jgi:hypothetical protein
LAYSLEAVQLCWKLAEEKPMRYNHDLASLLCDFADDFANLNQDEEALAYSLEAVELYQKLAREKPARYNNDFALSLHNLAFRLANLD